MDTLRKRQRRAARLALYSSFAVTAALSTGIVAFIRSQMVASVDFAWEQGAYADSVAVRLLQEYVRVDTSPTTGSELEGARFLAGQLSALGLEPRVESLGDGRANVWAVAEGETPEALVLHNHIDVSPAEAPDEWTYPPFGGVIAPPFIYGRGVFDMKSIAVAQLLALRDLLADGSRPRRSVVFLATGSEEGGSDLGVRWILRHHPELAARFAVVLTEGGVVEPLDVGSVRYWGIEHAQKQFAEGSACSPDRQRLEDLRQDILALQRWHREPRVHPEVLRFLASYGPSRSFPPYRRFLARVGDGPIDPVAFRKLPAYLRSFFLDELEPFPVEEDPDGGYRMRLVFHLLPGAELAPVAERLLPEWTRHGVDIQLGPALGAAVGSPTTRPEYEILESSIRTVYPTATVGPMFLCWSSTDARFFRQSGIPSYGYSPFLFFATETLRADRRNERVNLPGYLRGVEIYSEALRRLAE